MPVVILVAALAFAVLATIHFFRGPDRGTYAARNNKLLASLPFPNGAAGRIRQILPVEKTVFGEQLAHTVGYTTYVSYDLPADWTARRLVHFYRRRLPNWHETSGAVDGIPFACFDHDGATVSVQTDGMDPRAGSNRSFGLAVDYRGGVCD